MASRNLTVGEIAMVTSIYGVRDYSDVKVHDTQWILQLDGRPMAPNGEIHYKDGVGYEADFSDGGVSPSRKATFIHEMMHVIQYKEGIPVIPQWMAEEAINKLKGKNSYDYGDIFNGTPFSKLDIEAQAQFMRDLYRLRNGEDEIDGKNLEDFESVLPSNFPGSENPNPEDIYDPEIPRTPTNNPDHPTVPDWMYPAKGLQDKAIRDYSPLVLDLDNDGIETTKMGYGVDASKVYFDLDNDGFAERAAWLTGGDGLLAVDANSNGIIDNQSELFGNSASYADGFAKLSTLDSNTDGKITSADTNWSSLLVWVDANEDGVTDSGELKTMATLSITEISLSSTPLTNTYNNENMVSDTSTFVIGGQTRTISDVWFRADSVDTYYTGDIEFIPEALLLPTLKGFGILKDLHLAMSENSDLLNLVEDFVLTWDTEKFEDKAALDAEIEEILFTWAGVENVNPTSRDSFVDAQELEFLEALFADPYGYDPQPAQGPTTGLVFDFIRDKLGAQLIAQSGLDALYEEPPIYNYLTGDTVGGILSDTAIAALSTEADNAPDAEEYWTNVANVLVNIKTAGDFTSAEIAALDAAIQESLPLSSWAEISANAKVVLTTDHTYLASDFSDYIVGSEGNETFTGFAGDDTYYFKKGFGNDTVFDLSGNDTIQFAAGITLEDLRFERTSGLGYLTIFYSPTDSVILNHHFADLQNSTNYYDEVEAIRFADGSTFNLLGDFTFKGTAGIDVVYGTEGNDILDGGAGADSLYGGSGTDINRFSPDFSGDVDTIYQFSLAQSDKIDVSQIIQFNPFLDSITDFVEITTSGFSSIVKIDADGGGDSFVQIAEIWLVNGLTDEASLVSNGTLIVAPSEKTFAGLAASYFTLGSSVSELSEVNFATTATYKEVVSDVDHNTSSSTPFYTGGPTDNFAVSYNGYLNVIEAGIYTLSLRSDDGSALWIDGVKIIDNDGLHGAQTRTYETYLAAGSHTLDLQYFEAYADQIVQLSWSGADTDNTMVIIDGTALSHGGDLNAMPFAYSDTLYTDENEAVMIDAVYNDTDEDSDTIEIIGVTQGSYGSVVINLDGTITYTPDTDYVGLDEFEYTISDGRGGKDTAIVAVTVGAGSAYYYEDFEGGASGWSSNVTDDAETAAFTEYLGMFADGEAGADTSKLFIMSREHNQIVIDFDFYKIDSWDYGENFEIYINDSVILSQGFQYSDAGSASGSFTGGTWERTSVQVGNLGYGDLRPSYLDWDDGIYHYEITLNSSDITFELGFGSSLNGDINDEAWGVDNIQIEDNSLALGGGNGPYSVYDFEHGAIGWTNNQTDDSEVSAFTEYLGMFANGVSGQDTSKTFDLTGNQSAVTIAFDFYKIDSWDYGENFEIYINDSVILSQGFQYSDAGSDSGTFTGGTWERTSVQVGNLGYGDLRPSYLDWDDGIYHYEITLTNTDSTVKLGFGSTLSGDVNDEAWGIDNLIIGEDLILGTSTADALNGTSGHDLIDGLAGGDTIDGNGGDDVLYGGDGLDTLYGDTGADTFAFTEDSAFNNIDVIADFNTTDGDRLDLSDVLQGYDPLTHAITDWVEITTSGSNSILKVDSDGGGDAFVQIATITGVTGLTDESALVTNGNLIVS